MKKAIEITVLRVSSNGKYIEFIINCPKDFYFTDFVVNVYGEDDKYSLKDSLLIAEEGDEDAIYNEDEETWYHNKHYYSGQFKLEDIGVTKPEMFEIYLEAQHDPACDEEEFHYKGTLEETVYISDVSNVYSCLMNDILSLGAELCNNTEVQDRVIRNYLILYAHQEAMKLRELEDAKKYFELLSKCFTKCGKSNTGCSVCGQHNYTTYKPHNCGCK